MKRMCTVAEWLRLERTLVGDGGGTLSPGMVRDPGCSEVRGLRLGVGLAHVLNTLQRELGDSVRAQMKKFFTEDMRRFSAAAREVQNQHAGRPRHELDRALAEMRMLPEWAKAVDDQRAYEQKDAEMLDLEVEIDLRRMDASRVLPGWKADGEWPECELPMRHLAVLFEFGVLFDPTVEDAEGRPVGDKP